MVHRDSKQPVRSSTSANITGGSQTLNNLTINPSSTGTIAVQSSNLTVSGTLTVADTDTLSIAPGITLTHTGATTSITGGTISGSGTLRYTDVSGGPGSDGSIQCVVRYDASGGNVLSTTFDARTYANNVEFFSSSATARSIEFASGTYSLSGATSHFYIISNGDSPGNLTVTGAVNGPTVNIGGDLDFTGTGTSSEVLVSGANVWTVSGNVNFTDGTYTATSGNTLTMSGAGKTLTTSGNSLHHLSFPGTITLADETHTVAGNLTLGGGAVTAGSSTIVMTGTSNTIIGGSKTLNNLTINPSSTGTILSTS